MESMTNPAAGGGGDPTVEELRHRASELDVEGRSSMDKAELEQAIAAAERKPQAQPKAAIAPSDGTSGRPNLAKVAEARVADRKQRVISTQKGA